MEITNRLTHSLYVVEMHETLKDKKIGTNAVEQLTRKLCKGESGREAILEIVMKNRIKEVRK